jgi:hypothetical protein
MMPPRPATTTPARDGDGGEVVRGDVSPAAAGEDARRRTVRVSGPR